MKKKSEKVKRILTLGIFIIIFIGFSLIVNAAWSQGTFQAGSTSGILEVGFSNTHGYAKVSAIGNVDAYMNGSIAYGSVRGVNTKYFSSTSYEKSYAEAICNSPGGKIDFIECLFNVDSPDGSATKYMAAE